MQVKLVLVLAWSGVAAAAPCRPAQAILIDAKLDGTSVIECFEDRARTCWRHDLAKPGWTRVATVPGCDDCGTMRSSTIASSAVVTVCAPDGSACHTVTTPPAIGLTVAAQGALVAAVEDDRITVADARTGKLVTTIAPWSHPASTAAWTFRGDARFVGPEQLFAELGDGGKTFARVVAARTGQPVLDLPGELDLAPPVMLGDELVVAAAGGRALHLVDLSHRHVRSSPLFAQPASLALLAATPTSVIAAQNGGDGALGMFDGKAVTTVAGPPACR